MSGGLRPCLVVGGAVLVVALAACGVDGSGTIGREQRPVEGVRAVELTGSGRVSISQTGVDSLQVITDDNLLDHVSTDVEDGTLVLEVDGVIEPTDGIAYELTVADLDAIRVTGSGSVAVADLAADRLAVSISGSGSVSAAGRAAVQDVEISGSGHYDGRQTVGNQVTIDIGGNGQADVWVTDRLSVDIGGHGSVTYRGDPTVEQHVRGAGGVTAVEG